MNNQSWFYFIYFIDLQSWFELERRTNIHVIIYTKQAKCLKIEDLFKNSVNTFVFKVNSTYLCAPKSYSKNGTS